MGSRRPYQLAQRQEKRDQIVDLFRRQHFLVTSVHDRLKPISDVGIWFEDRLSQVSSRCCGLAPITGLLDNPFGAGPHRCVGGPHLDDTRFDRMA